MFRSSSHESECLPRQLMSSKSKLADRASSADVMYKAFKVLKDTGHSAIQMKTELDPLEQVICYY